MSWCFEINKQYRDFSNEEGEVVNKVINYVNDIMTKAGLPQKPIGWKVDPVTRLLVLYDPDDVYETDEIGDMLDYVDDYLEDDGWKIDIILTEKEILIWESVLEKYKVKIGR